MPRGEQLLFGPLGWSVVATAVNGAALATKAGVADRTHIVSGVSISFSGAIAAAVSVTLKDGTTILEQWELPASTIAPIVIEFKRAYVITVGALTELNIPALGAAIRGTAVLRGATSA